METVGASTPVRIQLKVQSVAAIPNTRCTQMGGAALVSGGPVLAESLPQPAPP